jgi:hypothetical protein
MAGLLAATTMASTVLLGAAAPARAAPLGTLAISPAAGTITAKPAFAAATTSAGCPRTHGQNVRLKAGRVGGPYTNLAPAGGDGTYGNGPFTVAPDRELTRALGASPANGDYEIVVECLGETTGQHPDRFLTTITVTGPNWVVKGAEPPPPATPTTTTLAVTPAGPVNTGVAVTLTATVNPAAAAGSVTFTRGGAALGTAPTSGGVATLTTTDLPAGGHTLKAAFAAADATRYAGSVSTEVALTVNGPPGGAGHQQEITTTVAPGDLSLTVAGTAVTLGGGTIGGQATGDLNKAKVTDQRGTNAGWELTGQVEQFTTAAGGVIPANQLGWDPTVTKVQGSGTGVPGAKLTPGTGLGQPKTLCRSGTTGSAGVYECGAKLTLGIPDTTAPGTYTATLTLTLA